MREPASDRPDHELRSPEDDALAAAAVHHRAGRLGEAASIYEAMLRARPDEPRALHRLGVIACQLGQVGAALGLLRHAIRLRPGEAEFHNALGAALQARGDLEAAVTSYREARRLSPRTARAHNNLGNALLALGRTGEAMASFEAALALAPDEPGVLTNLGNALRTDGRLAAAAATYRRALALDPRPASAWNSLGVTLRDRGDLEGALEAFGAALAIEPGHVTARDNLLLTLLYTPGTAPAAVLAEHRRWDTVHGQPPAGGPDPHPNTPEPGRRLRVGYVSPDFRHHAVASFFLPLLENHDRGGFAIVCYAASPVQDQVTARIRGLADGWRQLAGLNDREAAALVRADAIDILVDLACHTAGNRLPLFAWKPAPVQVTANVMTSGLSAMDYLVADVHLARDLPPGAVSETILRLPICYTAYEPPGDAPAVTQTPALSGQGVTFGSFNNLSKITPAVAALWAAVLQAVPGSILILKGSAIVDAETRGRVLALFRDRGVDDGRVTVLPWATEQVAHLALYGKVDIGLDTFPFNGCTTTCEALWMGVPVVTLAGSLFADRVGVSLLSAVGLPGLVAERPEDFVRTAAALADDVPALAALRASLRTRMAASPLCDGRRYARDLEAEYRRVWAAWCAHQAVEAGVDGRVEDLSPLREAPVSPTVR